MSASHFSREEEQRMNALQMRVCQAEALTDSEIDELAFLKMKYHNFLEEGERRLREGIAVHSSKAKKKKKDKEKEKEVLNGGGGGRNGSAATTAAFSSTELYPKLVDASGSVSPTQQQPQSPLSGAASPLQSSSPKMKKAAFSAQEGSDSGDAMTSMQTSMETAGKAAYFWGSLVATAVPGYIGRKTGLTTDFHHWNFITDRLVLGALPVITQVGSSGNHLIQLRSQLDLQGKQLGLVLACLEEEEMQGFGVGMITFAQERHWRELINPNVEYVRLPMPDTSADTSVKLVMEAVDRVHRCISTQNRVAYVHCKAGKGRSWMLVMCYLTTYGGMSFGEADCIVRSKRSHVNPSSAQREFTLAYPRLSAELRRSMREEAQSQLQQKQNQLHLAAGAVGSEEMVGGIINSSSSGVNASQIPSGRVVSNTSSANNNNNSSSSNSSSSIVRPQKSASSSSGSSAPANGSS